MYVSPIGCIVPREIIEHEGRLYFEVAEMGHCSVCQSRIDHIEQVVSVNDLDASYAHFLHIEQISAKNIDASYAHLSDLFPREARTLWVGLVKPKPEMTDEEIKSFIKKELNLPII